MDDRPGAGWVLAQLLLFVLFAVAIVFDGSLGVSVWRVLGWLAVLAGAGLAGAAVVTVGSRLSPFPSPVDGAPLRTGGPFALVRHPIYGGLLIAGLGLALATQSATGAMVMGMLAVIFVGKSTLEERLLTKHYPHYAEYRASVRRRFIPFVF